MFGFGKDKDTIHVEFYEDGKSTPFAVSDMPIDQLPDSLEINTTLQMGDDDWQVVDSNPKNKSDFKKTGELKVVLTKHQTTSVNPNEILYSLPTIADELAATEKTKSLENVAIFSEDDWRQFEFVSRSFESDVAKELNEIMKIYQHHKQGMGFKKIHLRTKITKPMKGVELKLDALTAHFGSSKRFDGVAFNTEPATIKNGFAFLSKENWLFWGQLDEHENIVVLNISQVKESDHSAISSKLDKFLARENLFLVDWLRVFWAGTDKEKFSEYGK